jgi:RNA polymerase sigma-70 factor (sigma-E family)
MATTLADVSDVTGPSGERLYAAVFHAHFRTVVRLAALLGADDPEDVAQEAFVRLHQGVRRLRDPDAALAYVRATAVNLCRSRQRHLSVVRRNAPVPSADEVSAEHAAIAREDAREVADALSQLSARHREALVLRYWLDLSEAEMAAAMGVSVGTVKSHVSRGLDALGRILEGSR